MSKAWESGSDTRWRRFRLTILERDKGLCTVRLQGCTTRAEEVDHIIPLSRGGPRYDPANCRASCGWCNRKRGDRAPVTQPQPRRVSSW